MAKNDALFRPYRTKVCFRNFFLFSPSTLPFNLFASSSRNSERRRQRRRHKMYRICTNEATTQSVKRRVKTGYSLQISEPSDVRQRNFGIRGNQCTAISNGILSDNRTSRARTHAFGRQASTRQARTSCARTDTVTSVYEI